MNTKGAYWEDFVKQLGTIPPQLPDILPSILSTLLGKPIAPNSKRQVGEGANNLLEMLMRVAPRLLELDKVQNRTEQKRAFLDVIEIGFRPYVKDIPQDQSVLDFIIAFLDPRKPLPQGSYLLETSYKKYMATVRKLATETVLKVPFDIYKQFLDSAFGATEDILSVGQTVMKKFPKMHKEFCYHRKRFTQKQAERDNEYYGQLAGHFEKCISTVAGVIKLIEGQTATYKSMRRRGLTSNLRTVDESDYSFLTTGFNKNIRNALAHRQWMYEPEKYAVSYYDPINEFSAEYTYREVSEKTKELSALVIALHQLSLLIYVETLVKFKETLKNKANTSE
jgi:hypothetical protein